MRTERDPAPEGTRPSGAVSGDVVTLRLSTDADKRDIYEWLAHSDVTASIIGPPLFPEVPVPSWEEFLDDYGPEFFGGANLRREASFVIEVDGRPVGQINYEVFAEKPDTAELDIWMRSEADTGHGYGPDALRALMRHLHRSLGIREFVIRPSARNPRAIAAYKKAGFETAEMSTEEQTARFGAGDYSDTVVLISRVPTKR